MLSDFICVSSVNSLKIKIKILQYLKDVFSLLHLLQQNLNLQIFVLVENFLVWPFHELCITKSTSTKIWTSIGLFTGRWSFGRQNNFGGDGGA